MVSKGRRAAAVPLAEARNRPMSKAQRARADYLEALIAGADRNWRKAISLFERAKPGLDPLRRGWAEYGRYAAASLPDPKRVQPPPKVAVNDPRTAEISTYITAFRQDLQAAAAEAAAFERRFPNDAGVALVSASFAEDLGRREDMYAAYERARAIAPNDPDVIAFGASIKADYARDIDGALADLYRVAETDPSFALLNQIGLLEAGRGAPVEAEAAYRRAIAMEPQNPITYVNLALFLLDQSRVEEAGILIDKALALDPPTAYSARGRYLLQKDRMATAVEALLAGSAVNPARSNDQLILADAYFQNGEYELARQTLDNADRLDPRSPIVPIVRTAFALDLYQADEAILAAREALQRYRARGGDYSGISVTKQTGSYPVQAYRFINLHDWGRFYADRTFDPFEAHGYFDQAIASRPGLFPTEPTLDTAEGTELNSHALNLSFQGLLLDPLAVAGRIGRFDPLRRPFLDTEFSASAITRGGKTGWQSGVLVNSFSNEPLPTSVSLSANAENLQGDLSADDESGRSLTFSLGTAPTAADRFLVMGWATEGKPGLTDLNRPDLIQHDERDATNLFGMVGWSHTFGYRNVLSAAVFATRNDTLDRGEIWSFNEFPSPGFPDITRMVWQERQRVDGIVGAVNHSIGIGEFNLRYGLEAQAGQLRYRGFSDTRNIYSGGFDEDVLDAVSSESPFRGGRAYADLSWRPNDRFEAQAGIHRTFLDVQYDRPDVWVSPRLGVGFSPLEGQWLRAAYIEDAQSFLTYSLAPTTTVGLIPNDAPANGPSKSLVLRWDAEWTPHIFTAVEYQRQTLQDLSIPRINTLSFIEDIDEARAEWLAATVNVWLGHGIGVFGTIGGATSEILEGRGQGEPVPYIPDRFARAGVTFVHPSRLRFTLTQNYIGERSGSYENDRLDAYWTTDAAITWETPDRHFQFGVTALNLFDQDYEFGFYIPAPGRTIAATIKARL
jgi:tetratricopeptide (TPR) repeat protein